MRHGVQEFLTFYGHTHMPMQVALSPDGTLAATSARGDGLINVWDLDGRVEKMSLAVPPAMHLLDFSPDGKYLAIGSGSAKPGGPVPCGWSAFPAARTFGRRGRDRPGLRA